MLVVVFVPSLAAAGLGNLRRRAFAIWIVAAIIVLAVLGAYDIFHDPNGGFVGGSTAPRNLPSAPLWLAAAAGLFIVHALVVSGDADRSYIAKYSRYFDVAWKHTVQFVLACVFVSTLWVLLWLGAELFRLIKIDFLAELLKKPWFSIPVSTIAFTLALHVTDVHASIVQGVRTLKLTLLSWLLLLFTLIAVGFLLALPFTGLDPLWGTRRAATIVLVTAAALVLLLNAAYQDGEREHSVAGILQYAGAVAAVALAPLVAIAAYAVMLRVGQYGWTPERIVAIACIVVAACYAVGYAIAAATGRPGLRRIEMTNIVTAIVIPALILALFSPIADPARIAVADQVRRLEAGKTSWDQFDFAFLRFHSGRYGLEALMRLKDSREGPDAARIADKAAAAIDWKRPADATPRGTMVATSVSRAANITVIFPSGQSLPDSFLQQDWTAGADQWRHPRCLTAEEKCEAIMADLNDDGVPEILLLTQANATAYRQSADKWVWLGSILNANCNGVRDALRSGKFEFTTSDLKDLQAAGQRLRIQAGCR